MMISFNDVEWSVKYAVSANDTGSSPNLGNPNWRGPRPDDDATSRNTVNKQSHFEINKLLQPDTSKISSFRVPSWGSHAKIVLYIGELVE